MSGIMGLAGFAEGFANSAKMKKDNARADAENARQDRWLAILEKNPNLMNASMGIPGMPDGGAGGYSGGAAEGGTGTPGQSTAGSTGGIFGLIDKTEGGGSYETLYGHSQNGGRFDGVNVTDMTLGQLYEFSDPNGDYGQWVKGQVGHVATPMGRHQIVGTTLRTAAKGMGLSPDTKFTPGVQDSIADYLATNRLKGLSSPAAKRAALRSEWEGFRGVSDAALDAAILEFEAGKAMGPRPFGIGTQ